MVCSGKDGILFELSQAGEIAWQYNYPREFVGQARPIVRAYRYGTIYKGLKGRDLTPKGAIE